jgi:D-glycero-alpha-D-manno-heptose 1-phosphate guanylyltransferase
MKQGNSAPRATAQSLAKMTAAILAGGLGTRLRQVVADRPKVLAEVQGRPMLAYLLQRLVSSGVSYVVLCTGHMGDQVRATFGESYRGLRLAYSQESSPLGTAGALRLALPLFESDSVFVMNGDSLCDLNLSSLCARHRALKAEGTIVLTESSDTSRYGAVRVDPEGFVVSFDEKGSSNGPGWINAGTYLLNQSLIATIPTDGPYSLERQMFPNWIQRRLFGYRFAGRFLDIGTPESYALAESFVGASPSPLEMAGQLTDAA